MMRQQSGYSDYAIIVCVPCNLINDCCTEFVQEINFGLVPKSHQFYLSFDKKKKNNKKKASKYKTDKLSNKNLTSRTVTTKEKYVHCITSS